MDFVIEAQLRVSLIAVFRILRGAPKLLTHQRAQAVPKEWV